MSSDVMRVQVGPIRKNRAQMRRTYDLTKLAELTMQMIARGFDGDRPLLIRRDGTSFENIRGHRRRMALLMTAYLDDLRPGHEWAIEEVRDMWTDLLLSRTDDQTVYKELAPFGVVETAVESLVAEFGYVEAPAIISDAEPKQATLALWSDNFGDEEPDRMGIAHSLKVGIVEQGITIEEAARNMGQSVHYVRNHLALAQIDPRLAQRINDKELGVAAAVALIDLPPDKQAGLTDFILANPSHTITVEKVKKTAKLLDEFSMAMPLTFPNASRRNIARAMNNLWFAKLEEDAARAYLGACIVLYPRGEFTAPWEDTAAIPDWLQALGVPVAGHWTQALLPYLTEVNCDTCPIKGLPEQKLKVDLIAPSLPCRQGFDVKSCFHGLAPGDPFHVRVHMGWAGHPGLVQEGGTYVATSFDDLLTAWKAQKKAEADQAKKEATAAKAIDEKQKKVKTQSTTAPAPATVKAPTPAPAPGPELEEPSAIEMMRAKIGLFMATHTGDGFDSGHFMATRCEACQHKLEASPTNDESVPHCAWASHARTIQFDQIRRTDGGRPIPYCRQYAPEAPWWEIVPEYPNAPLPRAWLVEQITLLAADRTGGDTYKPFQWLTGRPMKSNERYDDWFQKQFKTHKDEMSDGQIFTLFVLAHDEWKRGQRWGADRKQFFVPVDDLHQMIPVEMVEWKMEEA